MKDGDIFLNKIKDILKQKEIYRYLLMRTTTRDYALTDINPQFCLCLDDVPPDSDIYFGEHSDTYSNVYDNDWLCTRMMVNHGGKKWS